MADYKNSFKMKSLLSLSVTAVVRDLERNIETVQVLPNHLKRRLLSYASKPAGADLNSTILHALLHSNLRVLELSESCVTDESLHEIAALCKHLHELVLNRFSQSHLSHITTPVLMDLFPHLRFLSSLYIKNCPAVTDNVVSVIVKSCPRMLILDVGGCPAITDLSLELITAANLKLNALNISSSQVTELGIVTLVQGNCGRSLEELHLEKCKGITNFAIEAITIHCTNLQILQIQGCKITEESWHALDLLIAEKKVKQLSWTLY